MEKGKTNNPNGRPKGSENVLTKEMRTVLKSVLSEQIEKLPEMLEALSPEKKIDVLLRLLPFVVPKVEAVSPSFGEPFTPEW
jgi:hypothetical protein